MNKFQFSPPNGLLDSSAYPTNPATEAEARGQIQAPLNQLKDFINAIADGFNSSLAGNGYKNIDGLILQWGTKATPTAGGHTLTFPIKFPVECWLVVGSIHSTSFDRVRTSGVSATSAILTLEGTNSDTSVKWIAIGC